MPHANIEASWIGKAAYEITMITDRGGKSANVTARQLAEGLLDYGVDLTRIDPRDYAREHFGYAPVQASKRPERPATKSLTKPRTPTSKASWLGMAAHEIDEITNFGADQAAKSARDIADLIVGQGYALLDTDPRANAQLHFGADAMAAKRKARDEREDARRRRDNLMSDYLSGTDAIAA